MVILASIVIATAVLAVLSTRRMTLGDSWQCRAILALVVMAGVAGRFIK
jgi:hypothetical protein